MKEYNKYVKKWQDLTIQMNEAMQNDNFELADKLLKESNEAYNRYKECSYIPESNKSMTFGELNYMLENELPNLFSKNKQALKECTKLIKEDKNLLSQFKFIDSLRKYNCDGDAKDYVNESIALVKNTINKKTLRESMDKFASLLAKYEIGGQTIDENVSQYFQNCEKVLFEDKKLSNLTEYTNAVNSIAEYIESHKSPVVESKKSIEAMSEDLEKKIANLTEEEQSLVKDIIDFKQPKVEERQKGLFNKFKNECLETISSLISESNSEDDTDGLQAIKEQLEGKEYCKESIIQDIAQLLEIRDVLLEK